MKKYLLVLFVGLMAGASIVFAATNNFSDVQGNEWFAQSLKNDVQRGIINGYADGTFSPDNKLNRAEASVIADKSINYTIANDLAFDFYVWAHSQTEPQIVKIDNQDIMISGPNAGGNSESLLDTNAISNLATIISNKSASSIFDCKNELKKNTKVLIACKKLGYLITQDTEFAEM